jgi:ribosome biogenesis protein ENP2
MHGYFVASKLYEQAKLIVNPYAWEEERMKRVKDKVENERASRIRGSKKVKVNQKLADKIIKKQENRAKIDTNAGVLGDERFAQLFEDEEFMVDEASKVFQLLNPSTTIDEPVDPKAPTRYQAKDSDDDSSDSDEAIRTTNKSKDDMKMRVSSTQDEGRPLRDTALGSRTQKSGRFAKAQRGDVGGERQVTFLPESKKKRQQEQDEPPTRQQPRGWRRSASSNTFRKM